MYGSRAWQKSHVENIHLLWNTNFYAWKGKVIRTENIPYRCVSKDDNFDRVLGAGGREVKKGGIIWAHLKTSEGASKGKMPPCTFISTQKDILLLLLLLWCRSRRCKEVLIDDMARIAQWIPPELATGYSYFSPVWFSASFQIGNYKARCRSSKRDKHKGGKGSSAKHAYLIYLPRINLCT